LSKLTVAVANWLLGSASLPEQNYIVHDRTQWRAGPELKTDIEFVKSLFAACGLSRGERVLIGYPNSYAFVIAYFAALQSGMVAVPVNPGMPPAEMEVFLRRSKVRCGFFEEDQWGQLVGTGELAQNSLDIELKVVFTSSNSRSRPDHVFLHQRSDWQERTISSWMATRPDIPGPSVEADVGEDDIGVLLYTSGTTGRPKGVGLKHRHLFFAAQQVVASHQLTEEDIGYCILPLFHINAQVVVLLASCLSRGKVVLAPKFHASEFWKTIEEHQVTWVSAVPTIITILLNSGAPFVIPRSLRFVRSASARLPMADATEFERRFHIPIIQSYGMTEAASQICVNPVGGGKRKLASVGVPMGVELRVEDDGGRELGPNRVGEIVIRGNNVIEAYAEALNQDDFVNGWFHTGDLGYLDNDGYVYLTGRKKEIINRAGEKISPYEVEDVIREHPLVAQAAVIGLPDELYGERVAAYITMNRSLCSSSTVAQEVMDLCRRSLSSYKCPAEVHVLPDIPVGSTGKVQRRHLKEQVLQEVRKIGTH